MAHKYVLGMDIGGTNLRMGLINEDFAIEGYTSEKTSMLQNSNDPMKFLVDLIKSYCSKHLGGEMPKAISIGFPSTIDRTRKIVVSTPNILNLQNLAVVDIIEEEMQVPVYINRDVNFLLMYDMVNLVLDPKSTVIGIYVGTGLGNAIMIEGKLLLGSNGVAAELGHIPTYAFEEKCGCGNIGCIEGCASGIYLEKLRKEKFPDTPIDELFIHHQDSPELIKFIDNLAIPIATEINILDPDTVVLGGGILQMEDFPFSLFEDRIHFHTRKPLPDENLQLAYSSPNQENGVIGAGIYAFKRLNDPLPYYR